MGSKRTKKDRTQLSADYAKARQKDPATGEKNTTEDWWRSKAKYDYFFTKKLYGYLDGRYEKDAIAQLDRRMIVGSGGGYQWIESEDMNFSTEAGFASLYEKYDNQTDSTGTFRSIFTPNSSASEPARILQNNVKTIISAARYVLYFFFISHTPSCLTIVLQFFGSRLFEQGLLLDIIPSDTDSRNYDGTRLAWSARSSLLFPFLAS